jgi:hypothetical protein
MRNKLIAIGIILYAFSTIAVAQVAMGKWRTHLAYNSVTQIAQSENKIFAVSDGALFSVDKLDGGMEFYSKLSGLNGSSITRIEYDQFNKQLIIIYSNGNIDMLGEGGIVNVPDLYNKQMSASKGVNQIQFYQNKAFLSCDFGIIVLNTTKKEVIDTYYIGPNASEVKVLSVSVHNDSIYALTQSMIYKASIFEPNLVNYAFWKPYSGLPGSGNFQTTASFAGKLFLLRNGKIFKQESVNTWEAFRPDLVVDSINVSNGNLTVFTSNKAYLFDNLLQQSELDYSVFKKNESDIVNVKDAEYDKINETYWFAAKALGVVSYKKTGNDQPVVNTFKPEGPAVNASWDMTFSGEKLFVVQGGGYASKDNKEGIVMMFKNGNWTNIYESDIITSTHKSARDFMNVAVDPLDDTHFFVTSLGTGLFEFKNNMFVNQYTPLSLDCKLEAAVANEPYVYTLLDGAIYDASGNILLVNRALKRSVEIKILTKAGKWEQLSYPCDVEQSVIPSMGKILISNQNPNQKWIPSIRYAKGIFIYDDKGTLTDQSDDQWKFYQSFTDPDNLGSAISPNNYFCLAQDKNGVVWAGTEQGPFLFHNPSKVFDKDYTCSRIKIPRNDGTGLADYLLANEIINAIAIDGANRKWIATKASGVYLMSENGQETIQHFTVSNSPLLSNYVMTIKINPISGEVYFGTSLGIISYQSDAADAGSTFGEVYAYPNPVRENYNGVITITGLVKDTQVKITDLTGNLICETVSNGSIATWDGKDVHGRKVSTGIYLAVCASEDGTQSAITKIMVIN